MSCVHTRVHPQVFDQTLGVSCPDCKYATWCWNDKHVSEYMWNLACLNDAEAVPCDTNRTYICALCEEFF